MAIETNKLGNSSSNNPNVSRTNCYSRRIKRIQNTVINRLQRDNSPTNQGAQTMAQIKRSAQTFKHFSRHTPNPPINGILTYSKIGGIIYYKYEDIVKLLEKK